MSDPTKAWITTGSESKTLTRSKPWDFRSCASLYVNKPPVLRLGLAGAEASGRVGAEMEKGVTEEGLPLLDL
ncbi:hypothetical protein ACFX15_031472 [Malus domestica]